MFNYLKERPWILIIVLFSVMVIVNVVVVIIAVRNDQPSVPLDSQSPVPWTHK